MPRFNSLRKFFLPCIFTVLLLMTTTMINGCAEQSDSKIPNQNPELANKQKKPVARVGDKQNLANPHQKKMPKQDLSMVPENLWLLAGNDLQDQFPFISFSWNTNTVNWEFLTADEKAKALTGIFVRHEYQRGTVRIVESYRKPEDIRLRYQQQLVDGKWESHGPSINFLGNGGFNITYYVKGHPEGVSSDYNSSGTIIGKRTFKDGILQE